MNKGKKGIELFVSHVESLK